MIQLLLSRARVLLIWGVFFGAVAGLVSFLMPTYYAAEAQVLIISRDRSATDQYTQVRSAELIGQTISQVMQTQDFYDKVMEQSGQGFDKSRWQNLNARDRQKAWKRDVIGGMVYGTSLLKVRAYGKSQVDAIAFNNAIIQTVANRSFEYLGTDVTFKLVDNPVYSPWLTRPNWIVNAFAGFALGVALVGIWVVRYRRHTLFSKE